jgi:zinc transport system substrate-binding protein
MISFDKEHEGHHHACCYSDFEDIHIWLSVREAKAQAINIAKALQRHYPQNAALYEKNLQKFLEDLDDTDKQMTEMFKEGPKVIMVSHPAYGYLARDYNFALLSVEFEGKDPTPKQLTEVLNRAKEEHIQKVFVQPQHSSKGARLIAQKLGAEVVDLDPLSEDYLNNMLKIAKEFASSKK